MRLTILRYYDTTTASIMCIDSHIVICIIFVNCALRGNRTRRQGGHPPR